MTSRVFALGVELADDLADRVELHGLGLVGVAVCRARRTRP